MSEEQTLNEVYADTLKKMENLTEKQKKVLQASLELFASQGFEATTSQQIAKRAGVSVGSVYHTFPTKQAILVAVLAPIFRGQWILSPINLMIIHLAKDLKAWKSWLR